ncbi:CvpA family protein [Odoribacter sp. OttesenSCG-928-L07]|nr:CvpA family protein [Odoribacter sp. OttesenSCG-928-L07]MDL2238691.1 CvpA family protein [Bacteroidales bacterium OttesenSCG-928-L14]
MNWLDIVILIPCVWFFYTGFKNGFVKSITQLIALILGIWVSIKFSDGVLNFCFEKFPQLQEHTSSMSPQLIKIIAFVVVFILVIIVIHLIGTLVDKLVSMIALSSINKIIGGAFGVFKGLLITGVIIYILNMFNIINPIIKEDVREKSFLYTYVEKVVPTFSDFITKKRASSEDSNDTLSL